MSVPVVHVARAGAEFATCPATEVPARLAAGEFLPTDHYWAPGMAAWRRLAEFAPTPRGWSLRVAARRRLPRPIFDYIDGGADDERLAVELEELFRRAHARRGAGGEDDGDAALHVRRAGAAEGLAIEPGQRLERVVCRIDRVHVGDQQHLLALRLKFFNFGSLLAGQNICKDNIEAEFLAYTCRCSSVMASRISSAPEAAIMRSARTPMPGTTVSDQKRIMPSARPLS